MLEGILGTFGSRTFWGHVALWAVWAGANALGVSIPVEAPLAAGAAIGVKEAARRIKVG
jgi:hypothetical protein